MGQGEVIAQVGQTTVVFPDGVAPAGTKAKVSLKPSSEMSFDEALTMSEIVEIGLEEGLQPEAPVTITIPVDAGTASASEVAESYFVFGLGVADDGTESFHTGSFDAASSAFSMTVDHFSTFTVLGLDIGAALEEARTAVMQGIGFEFAAPDCINRPAVIDGTTYEVISPAAAHMCTEERNGSLVVTAYPAIAIPYLITSAPSNNGETTGDEISLSTAGMIVIARALGLLDSGGKTGIFPGAKAVHTFDGTPESIQFVLEQYPVLLLMAILAETLDVLGLTSIEQLEGLQCLVDVADSNSAFSEGITGEAMGAFATTFFSCAGAVGDLTPLGRFVLSVLGAAPGLLVSGFLGATLEFTGLATQYVEVTVTPPAPPKAPDTHALLNAELPPNVCWTGIDGWEHESGIQLTDGVGIARWPDGSFADASVIESSVLGVVDLNGDGRDEAVMALACSGSHPDTCCAGRSSKMVTVATLAVADDGTLQLAAPSFMGGESLPGDEFGPAPRQIVSVELQGNTVVTSETIIYADHYTEDQVGGDPYLPVTVTYQFTDDGWIGSEPRN